MAHCIGWRQMQHQPKRHPLPVTIPLEIFHSTAAQLRAPAPITADFSSLLSDCERNRGNYSADTQELIMINGHKAL